MKILKYIIICIIAFSVTNCYDEFANDFDYSTVYFASQQPLRTVVADANMKIKVGVAIGGKRTVSPADWATFAIDPTLLTGTTLTLMPETYYTLSNADKMTVSNPNLAIADVEVTFTEAFYNDPNAVNQYYAIPFKITGHNLDSIGKNQTGVLKDYTIVAVKAISKYHGTYYVRGSMVKLNPDGTPGTLKTDSTIYSVSDLSKNLTRDIFSVGRYIVQRPGFANNALIAAEAIKLTVSQDGATVAIQAGGTTAISDATASLDLSKSQPEFQLQYKFIKSGTTYQVNETLIRRQNPEKDLRFEEWK
ncbi:MAG: DUF1735 domain-containing protein [Paludibacter sp.]|nr:DUF1735 domain-containing protein [Paludibacter sp.]